MSRGSLPVPALPVTLSRFILFFFFFNDTATTEIYTLSLHDALPILLWLKTFYPSAYYETFLNLKGEKGNELLVKRLIAEFREIGGTIQIIDLQNSKE